VSEKNGARWKLRKQLFNLRDAVLISLPVDRT